MPTSHRAHQKDVSCNNNQQTLVKPGADCFAFALLFLVRGRNVKFAVVSGWCPEKANVRESNARWPVSQGSPLAQSPDIPHSPIDGHSTGMAVPPCASADAKVGT